MGGVQCGISTHSLSRRRCCATHVTHCAVWVAPGLLPFSYHLREFEPFLTSFLCHVSVVSNSILLTERLHPTVKTSETRLAGSALVIDLQARITMSLRMMYVRWVIRYVFDVIHHHNICSKETGTGLRTG